MSDRQRFLTELERLQIEEPIGLVGRRLKLTPASGIRPLPVRWHWAHRVPVGEITLTPGLGGVGKSTFHAWVIAQTTRGTLPGDYYGKKAPAIICASEDSWSRSIVPRLIVAGADLDFVYRADVVTDEGLETRISLPADLNELEAEIRDRGVAVISLDPLLSTVDLELDTHKNREVRDALEPLHRIADETRSVVLGNAHFNKSTGSDPLQRITGSTAFGEVCRAAVAFARDTDSDQYVLSQVKNNLGRLDLPNLAYRIEPATINTDEGPSEVGRFVFTGEQPSRGVKDILDRAGDHDRTERDMARDIILAAIEPDGTTWKDLAARVKSEGVSERTGRRARDDLRKAGLIDFTGGGGQPYMWHRMADSHSRAGGLGQPGQPGQPGLATEEVGQSGRQPPALTPLEVVQVGQQERRSPREASEEVGQPPGCEDCGQPRGHLQWCPHSNQLGPEEIAR